MVLIKLKQAIVNKLLNFKYYWKGHNFFEFIKNFQKNFVPFTRTFTNNKKMVYLVSKHLSKVKNSI